LFMIWLGRTFYLIYAGYGQPHSMQFTPFEILGTDKPFESLLTLSIAFFIIGTFAAFVTPIGGLVQLLGMGLFSWSVFPDLGPDVRLGAGVVVGFVSTAVVLCSLFFPIGFGLERKKMSFVSRLFAVSSESPTFRFNLLSTVGVALGIFCLFLPWATTTWLSWEYDPIAGPYYEHVPNSVGPIDYLTMHEAINAGNVFTGMGDQAIRIGVAIFLAGCVLGCISPLAGVLQIAGSLLFAANIGTYVAPKEPDVAFLKGTIDLGFYLAVLGGCLVVAGVVFPVGIGHGGLQLRDRALVWHIPDKRSQPSPSSD